MFSSVSFLPPSSCRTGKISFDHQPEMVGLSMCFRRQDPAEARLFPSSESVKDKQQAAGRVELTA